MYLRNLAISTHIDLPHSSFKLQIIPLDECTHIESRNMDQALMLCQALCKHDRKTCPGSKLLFLLGLCEIYRMQGTPTSFFVASSYPRTPLLFCDQTFLGLLNSERTFPSPTLKHCSPQVKSQLLL